MSRSQAQQRCDALSLDGVSDYRLPTLGELRSLVTDCSATRTGGPCGVTDQCLTSSCADLSCKGCDTLVCALPDALDGPCDVTWSSSTVQGASNKVWAIDFGTGQIGSLDATSAAIARCVSGSATKCQPGSSGTQVVSDHQGVVLQALAFEVVAQDEKQGHFALDIDASRLAIHIELEHVGLRGVTPGGVPARYPWRRVVRQVFRV